MKRLKTVLLILGIVLLAAGVWKQDEASLVGLIISVNVIEKSQGAPSWADINSGRELVRGREETGFILKLVGLAILFALFFLKMHQAGNKEGVNTKVPTAVGLGSAICLAVYAAWAPISKFGYWVADSFVFQVPSANARVFEPMRDAYLSQGSTAVTGLIFLAIGLFLLAYALITYRRGANRLIAAPIIAPAAFLALQERAVIEEETITGWETLLRGGYFTVIGWVLLVVSLMFFVWALIVRNKKPDKSSLLTIALLVIAGGSAVVFWILWLLHVGNVETTGTGYPFFLPPAQVMPLVSMYMFSVFLLFSSIFLPILCAFSLRRQPEKVDKITKTGKLSFPVTAGGIALIALLVAGFVGLRRDPYKELLSKVGLVFPGDPTEYMQDKNLQTLESEESLQRLLKMLNDPGEYYWHPVIAQYLWEHCRNPKAREMLFDMLADPAQPLAGAWAGEAMMGLLPIDDREQIKDALLSHLSRKPEHASAILDVALESNLFKSSFVFDILKTSSKAGVDRFSFHKGKRTSMFEEDDLLQLPKGFTIHYNYEPRPEVGKFVIKLVWWKPHSRVPGVPPKGRLELYAGEKKYEYVQNCYGQIIPNYAELAQDIRKARKSCPEPRGLWIELQVDPRIWIEHVRFLLNACGKAAITGVSIVEAEKH